MTDRYDYIINIAEEDDNIRAVFLYGSRVNSDIQPDLYQDYDIYYIVNDKDKFDISVFEKVMLRFMPSKIYPDLFSDEDVYLMLFEDDSRIDLTIGTMQVFLEKHMDERISRCLLDKDNKSLKVNTDDKSSSWVKKLDATTFKDTCSEFFGEIQNMAKGLKRDELSYAMFIRDISLRDMLNRIIDEYIGMNNNYSVSVGTLGKYRKNYLSQAYYELYKKTYYSNTVEDTWESLFYMIDLFSLLGKCIADKHGYKYPNDDEYYMRNYLERIIL